MVQRQTAAVMDLMEVDLVPIQAELDRERQRGNLERQKETFTQEAEEGIVVQLPLA